MKTKEDLMPQLIEKITKVVEPEVGAEANTDGSFTVSIESEISMLVINSKDLVSLIENIITSGEESTKQFTFNSENIPLTNVVVSDDKTKVSFDIASSGDIKLQIDEEDLIDEIKGKSREKALNYILGLDEVSDANVIFFPDFLPKNLQFIPNDEDKINIDAQ